MSEHFTMKHFSFNFPNKDLLFDDVNLTLSTSQITLISGSNGCGKTTFCRLLTGLINQYDGELTFQDKELRDCSVIELSHDIIFVKQEPRANVILTTPDEDLALWQKKFIRSDNETFQKSRQEALDKLSIKDYADSPLWELSNGQLKRVSLASLVIEDKKYWILDEPMTGLDQKLIDQFLVLLSEHKQSGYGALIISHRKNKYKTIADRYLTIKEKKITDEI